MGEKQHAGVQGRALTHANATRRDECHGRTNRCHGKRCGWYAHGQVAYFYDPEIGNFYYGQGHPMKPHRMRMAHDLLHSYGMLEKMEVYQPEMATEEDMTKFHTDDYVEFLRLVTPDNQHEHLRQLKRFNVGEDCPVFDGLYQFCQLYTGGSIGGAVRLNAGLNDVAVNWSGGLHHGKKCEASGFCYINDIVLAILELLKYHQRVLYIDIDIHHGDGVEEAFYTTDRVMTCSFHKFGDYFPGTGSIQDIGHEQGKYYSLNVPLRDGVDDESFEHLFKTIIAKVMEMYQPEAIVFQGGADSLSGDRLGCFNLSIKGHAECLKFVKKFGVPLLVLGGGGYTIRNVARCWAYETGCLLDEELENNLPDTKYYEYYGPTYQLQITPSNMENQNSMEMIEKIIAKTLENLSLLKPPSGIAMGNRPPDTMEIDQIVKEDPDKSSDGMKREEQKGIASGDPVWTESKAQESVRIQQDFNEVPVEEKKTEEKREPEEVTPIASQPLPIDAAQAARPLEANDQSKAVDPTLPAAEQDANMPSETKQPAVPMPESY